MPVSIPGFRIGERVHQSGPRVVYRAVREAQGDEVILKTLSARYPTKHDLAEIHREFQIAQGLQSISGVIRVHALMTHGHGNLAIVMESFGISLADFLAERAGRPLPLERWLPLARRLTEILGAIHQRQIVHKDLVPRNILLDPDTDQLRLIDFGISSELSRERQGLGIPKRLEGSLPYISPEQTGRMNRDLDYRSDYYSLGVTLFELATGRLPFSADHALEWVHRHISSPPPSASALNPDFPGAVSAIILKLMAKNADARYQSARGLDADLERCQEQLESRGSIRDFALGEVDVSRIFQIPEQVYGRQRELEKLESCFQDVAAGLTVVCMVSGHSGVGKSALVNELSQSIVGERGYLIRGKFEQFQQRQAYSALAAAFQGLVQQLLSESKERLDAWREALLEGLGGAAGLIVDLVPDLALIVGEQPPTLELAPTESHNRFQIAFVNFVKVFARARRPIVLFMDDLQWGDAPTLSLLQHLITAREMSHLFLIGAYRSNLIESAHPLHPMLQGLRRAGEVLELSLDPLPIAAVSQMTADTLKCDLARARPLAELLFEKAQGNPFFIKALLKSLYDDGLIAFNAVSGRWEWDLGRVRQVDVGENVVAFLITSLRRLKPVTQQVLRLAACIGSSFDLRTLAIIHEESVAQTAEHLLPAVKANILIPLDQGYKFVGLSHDSNFAEQGSSTPGDVSELTDASYRFQHDRIQQAAYELIDGSRKQAVHLSIGRLMLRHSGPEKLEERVIDIVRHLNEGKNLISDPRERRELSELNLRAGQKAMHLSAYQSALQFLKFGQTLLPDNAWDSEYQLTLALSHEYQQCAYLTGDYQESDNWTERMLQRARTGLEKAGILSQRTRQYATIGKMRESIQAAIAGLKLLDIEFTEAPGPDAIQREVERVQTNLGGRSIAELIEAERLSEPRQGVAIQLLMEIFPAAFLSGSGALFPYLVLKSVNISLEYGNSPESAFAYAAYGMLLCGVFNAPALGYQYGTLAVAMNERFDDIKLKSRVIYVYTMFVHHWTHHWSSMTPWFQKGIEAGYQSGDLLYLAYSAQDCVIWDPKLDLETASQEQRKYLTIVRDCEYQDSLDSGTLFLQTQLNLLGRTQGLYSLSDADFDEERCVEGMRARRFMTGIANFHIYKAELYCLYENYEAALEHVLQQDALIESSMSLPQLVRFQIVAFLTRAALYPSRSDAEQAEFRVRLDAALWQMTLWAEHCPTNFAHLLALMQAELARLSGSMQEALGHYERAIEAAHNQGFLRDEAVANERAAKYLLGAGLPKAAEAYLRAAHYLYYRWGARRKVELLEAEFEIVRQEASLSPRDRRTTAPPEETLTGLLLARSLDMVSVIQASQAISGEMVPERLWKTTLQILLQNAGGQRGCLVLRRGGRLVIEARGEAGVDAPAMTGALEVESADAHPSLPISIINTAMRTGQPVVLNDATRAGRFASDPYLLAERPQSLICVPLRHGQFEAVLYIENRLTPGALTEDRVEVIKLLSAQASISVENAGLYEEQLRLTEAQRRFVPSQFLESLGHHDIARVGLGEYVAKEMSVMFSDLREFTPLAERLPPGEVIELLNRYFSSVGAPIAESGGFIDSYNGDEVMALFGVAPDRAVRAGVEMRRALERFNLQLAVEGRPMLKMGIGVNTGPLVLGTVGARERLKCGVVGDTVNLASRIEQLTKRYGAPFLIGEPTHRSLAAPARFSFRRVDRVAVKGKLRGVALYEVLDAETSERRAAKESSREILHAAMDQHYAGDFLRARSSFEAVLARDPEDAVPRIFIERCEQYLQNAPTGDWEGYETLQQKS